jgi:carbonic anhydrase
MLNRRDMVTLLGATALLPLFGETFSRQESHHEGPAPVSPEEALARLKEGNQRFVSGKSRHEHESSNLRHQLVSGQHPFATVLGCSDSRVPIELIFDQGIGDLFVIRVAGNVITDDVIGSIEYAAIHLNSRLLVILGHEGCGAVTAAIEARSHASSDPHGIQTIVSLLETAIGNVNAALPKAEQVHRGVEANVRWALDDVKKMPEMHNLPLHTQGAVYDLEGAVRWLS